MKNEEIRSLLTEEPQYFRMNTKTSPSMGVVKKTIGTVVSVMLEGLHDKTVTLVVKDPGQSDYTFFDEPISEKGLGLKPTPPDAIRSYKLENIITLSPMED